MISRADARQAAQASLRSLDPALFQVDGIHARADLLRSPAEMTPQMALHWIASSTMTSMSHDLSTQVAEFCARFGASPLKTATSAAIRKGGVALAAVRTDELVARDDACDFDIVRLSPLGAAILARNTQAITVLGSLIEDDDNADPDAEVAALRILDKSTSFDVWSLCGRLGILMPLEVLERAYRIHEFDPRQERRLGRALEALLLPRATQIANNLHERKPGALEAVVRGFLIKGATPSPTSLLECGLDPAWMLGLMCTEGSAVHLKGLKRLVAGGYCPDPVQLGVKAPLHIAVEHDNAQAVIALLDAGADPKVMDDHGRTLEEAVHQDGRSNILDIIRVWTARRLALDVEGLFDCFAIRKPRGRRG